MVLLPELAEHVQAPGTPLPDQAENGREVVGENDHTEPTAVDQSRSLEDLVILGGNFGGAVLSDGVRVLPFFPFVDLQEFLGNVLDETKSRSDQEAWSGDKGGTHVVIAIEQNQENADGGRE